MSRFQPKQSHSLDELVPQYAERKAELDELDAVVKSLNSGIKSALTDRNIDSYSAGGYVAKMSTQVRETMMEDALLEVLKHYGITSAIKTKEYVDMDELENYLYNNSVDPQLMLDMNNCKVTKEVVQLRISKEKEKKENG